MMFCTPTHLIEIFGWGYAAGLITIPLAILGWGALNAWKNKK